MIDDFEKIKAQLEELAPIINSFKSESVQLKVVDLLLSQSANTTRTPADVSHLQSEETQRTKRRNTRGRRSATKSTEALEPDSPEKQKASRGGTGAQSRVSALHDEGFFKSPQTIKSIIDHCGTSKGHHFTACCPNR